MSSVTEQPTPAASPAAPGAPQQAPTGRIRGLFSNQQFLLLIALVVLIAFFEFRSHSFLSSGTTQAVLQDYSVLILLAVGETYVIISGGIDLSVGANAAISGVLGAMVMSHMTGSSEALILVVGTIVCALTGVVVGLVNAGLMLWARLVPFVATLATLGACSGLSLVLTNGAPLGSDVNAINVFSAHVIGPISWPMLAVFMIAGLTWIWLQMTRYGRYTYAVGSSSFAARAAGINVRRHLMSVYLLSGFLGGLTGMIYFMRLGSAAPTSGVGTELQAIAAVVIGGVSLTGGVGKMSGTILGGLIIVTVVSGLIQINLSPNWKPVAVAICIAVAASLQALRAARRREA